MHYMVMDSPIGKLRVIEQDGYITRICAVDETVKQPDTMLLKKAYDQLSRYFSGDLREFDLPLKFDVSPFYRKVLDILLTVTYGKVISYKQLAQLAGSPRAARAVGSAMRTNPLPIIIPCHRVIPSSGKLGNYSLGGAEVKRWLLEHEKD